MAARMSALAVSACVAAAAAVVAAAAGQSSVDVLVFERSETQLALQSSAHSVLWTLPAGAGLEDVVASAEISTVLCGGGGGALEVASGSALEQGTTLRCSAAPGAVHVLVPAPGFPAKPELRIEDLTDPSVVAESKAFWERIHSQPREYPFEPVQVMGDGISEALAWAYQFVTHHWGPRPEYPAWKNGTGIFHLGSGAPLPATGAGYSRRDDGAPVRVALAADWGAGTREADYVAQLIAASKPDYTVHMGDVYLVGTEDEIRSNVLGEAPPGAAKGVRWPAGALGTFAVAGNHENYSARLPFFSTMLPELTNGVQESGFFMLENSYFRLVFLDTGYNTYSPLINSKNNTQPPVIIDWLTDVVGVQNASDTRPIVLFTHHQYRSAFDSPYPATPAQLAKLLPPGRNYLWLWGHEHRLGIYKLGADSTGIPINAYGRCIGVGGFPVSLGQAPPNAREAGLEAYDDRVFQTVEGLFKIPVGWNGWTELELDGPTLRVDYRSLAPGAEPGVPSNTTSSLLMTESFKADASGSLERVSFEVVNANITVVQNL